MACSSSDAGEASSGESRPSGVPAAGESETIDDILARGSIIVGASENFPWLFQQDGEWEGPAWMLTQAVADALEAEVEIVDVSNETKVPILVNGGVDMTISPLAKNAERAEVINFAPFGSNAYCAIGLETNPKVAAVDSVDDLNSPDLTIASYVGSNQASFTPEEFPEAESKEVTGSGSQPVSEVLAGRSDFVLADQGKVPQIMHQYPDVVSVPEDCVSSELGQVEQTIGLPKDDQAFTDFVNEIGADMESELMADQQEWLEYGAENPEGFGG